MASASPTPPLSRPQYSSCIRYISDRFLPDKAIDLIDEAAARLRMQVELEARGAGRLDRRIMQLKIEQEALKKETDPASRDRLNKLQAELAELQEKSDSPTARWRAEKDKIGLAQKLKEELDAARTALAQAQRRGDFAEAGKLAYGTIPELEKRLAEAETQREGALVSEEVTANHVAQVVSRWDGAFQSTRCSRASAKNSSRWRRRSCAASSARKRP